MKENGIKTESEILIEKGIKEAQVRERLKNSNEPFDER
jgi:hypothetical protein